jgi:hypothetical protein
MTTSEVDALDDSDEERHSVADDDELDETVAIERYDITSFGADYDVEGLVKRLNRGDVFIPPFQRDYVWTQKEASKFIESLLLGLPVPGVFMAREPDSNKLLVIDGQQRLKSLQFFFNGVFNPRETDRTQRVFKLSRVQPQFDGLTYLTLSEQDRVKLNDAIIHATIVKQESPAGDDTSIYYIFERLNYGGRKLSPQEIRTAIYHGPLVDTLMDLNTYRPWRQVYGKESARLKDQELILRFIAFLVDAASYSRPMTEFLNRFSAKYRRANVELLDSWKTAFRETIDVFVAALGKAAFRRERAVNAAVFDSVAAGMARRLQNGPVRDSAAVRAAYEQLLNDGEFREALERSTADERFVQRRLAMATDAFAPVA